MVLSYARLQDTGIHARRNIGFMQAVWKDCGCIKQVIALDVEGLGKGHGVLRLADTVELKFWGVPEISWESCSPYLGTESTKHWS